MYFVAIFFPYYMGTTNPFICVLDAFTQYLDAGLSNHSSIGCVAPFLCDLTSVLDNSFPILFTVIFLNSQLYLDLLILE